MSFEIFQQPFGDLTEYVIQDKITQNRCSIVPEIGGIVRQLSLRKELTLFSVLKTPPTPEALLQDSKSASELLFPFASRIPGGQYTFLGRTYQLVNNEEGNANAIHGLVRKQRFHVEEQEIHSDRAAIKLSFTLENREGYSFKVHFSVSYTLHKDGRFVLAFEGKNIGSKPCPAMFGWHPYFQLGNEDVEAWKINIPSNVLVSFDDNQIPTGTEPFTMRMPALLYRKEFDNCFKIDSKEGTATTELISENQHVTLCVTQQTGPEKCNHLVIYTPPSRDCVGIEPLTGNVNCFNSGDGLVLLTPGQVMNGEITVALK